MVMAEPMGGTRGSGVGMSAPCGSVVHELESLPPRSATPCSDGAGPVRGGAPPVDAGRLGTGAHPPMGSLCPCVALACPPRPTSTCALTTPAPVRVLAVASAQTTALSRIRAAPTRSSVLGHRPALAHWTVGEWERQRPTLHNVVGQAPGDNRRVWGREPTSLLRRAGKDRQSAVRQVALLEARTIRDEHAPILQLCPVGQMASLKLVQLGLGGLEALNGPPS